MNGTKQGCSDCSSQHGVWRRSRFKGLHYQDQMKIVQEHAGFVSSVLIVATMQECAPEQTSNARNKGANKEQTTPSKFPSAELGGGGTNSQLNWEGQRLNATDCSNCATNSQEGVTITVATGVCGRVCLSVVPLKV